MKRNRMFGTDMLERAVGQPARAHVVLCMYLKEAVVLPLGPDRLEVFVLEARTSQSGRGISRKAELRLRSCVPNAGERVHRDRLRFPTNVGRLGFQWGQGAMLAARNHDVRAGAALDELPGVPLKVDGRGALARRAGAGGAVI